MEKFSSNDIRNKWMNFFKRKAHEVLESASVIPDDDDSLLFINAGVTPLKKYFDGSVVPENKRLASIQKCIRTNDIENVGVTKRHLTFFEMMGNFSIGDYFKNEALEFSFEFLTDSEWMGIPKDKLYVTVYPDDMEAFDKWVELGMDKDHIAKIPGNFWEIGEGPCGPDSEIFYDRGEHYDLDGKALEHFFNDEEQERYIEIWNNVFSQYNSKVGVSRDEYKELPNKNIDTGAGLERWCTVFQDVDSVFDTDLFVPTIKKLEDLSEIKYEDQTPFRVIADHIRTITVALSDGAMFENNGRGYVLRRLLRRSVRMGKKIGINEPFMYKLVGRVVEIMSGSYPELIDNKGEIKALVFQEEELFNTTLVAGERKLQELIDESKDKTISGYDAFKLYDTYGFPFELTLEYLEEIDFTTSREEFDKYMSEAKKLAKESNKKEANMNLQNEELLKFEEESEFTYEKIEMDSKVIALVKDEKFVDSFDDKGYVILDKTCFYAESGGQVADTGAMKNNNFKAKVLNVIKAPNGQHLHEIEVVEGSISVDDLCTIKIQNERRDRIARNHSSIHIIQKILQNVLSSNVHQAGSYVDDDYLRFDFTYTGKILEDKILEIEKLANEVINQNIDSNIEEMTLSDAKKKGAMALFSEKYKNIVRVVSVGESMELCGGTHVTNTGEIGELAILNVESKGSNLYRLEATTGDKIAVKISAIVANYVDEVKKLLFKADTILENAKKEGIELGFFIDVDQREFSSYADIIYNKNQLEYVQTEVRNLEKQYKEEKLKLVSSDLSLYTDNIEKINGINTIIMTTEDKDLMVLKDILDKLIVTIKEGVVFIANVIDKDVNFLCKSNVHINAGYLVKQAALMANGNGGGSPNFAQGGAKEVKNLDKIMEAIKEEIK